jgi:hypothetical protein
LVRGCEVEVKEINRDDATDAFKNDRAKSCGCMERTRMSERDVECGRYIIAQCRKAERRNYLLKRVKPSNGSIIPSVRTVSTIRKLSDITKSCAVSKCL